MDRTRATSMVSFERSFAELQKGHGFCYVFLIGCMWNIEKYSLFFFFAIVTTLEKSLSASSIKDISASKEARQLFKKTNLLSSKNLQNECNLVTVA